MNSEDYRLLEKEFCARLPYGLKVEFKLPNYQTEEFDTEIGEIFGVNLGMGLVEIHGGGIDYNISAHKLKPILRSMSSMTEEETAEYEKMCHHFVQIESEWTHKDNYFYDLDAVEWLNEHHFDYRGLIEKGLALEASEGMYIKDNC